MSTLQSVRSWFSGRPADSERSSPRVTSTVRVARVVNLNSMKVSKPLSEEEMLRRLREGRVAEMTERQAGL